MTPREKGIRDTILEWHAKAEGDFRDAKILLSHEPPSPGGAAFHSQQCAEKYLKAFLVRHDVEFPKTHDIKELLNLIEAVDAALAESLHDAMALTPYGVTIRYPGDFPDVSPSLAREAFGLASKVRDAVREALGDFVGGGERETS